MPGGPATVRGSRGAGDAGHQAEDGDCPDAGIGGRHWYWNVNLLWGAVFGVVVLLIARKKKS